MGISLSTNKVSRVELLLAIARAKGSLLSVEDIDELTGSVLKGSDLGSIWSRFPGLDSRYELEGGLLIEKSMKDSKTRTEIVIASNQRRVRAVRYIEYARDFSLLCGKRWIRVLSVAGSTAYKAASENDDIDVFCVTEADSLWIYLTKALILARVVKLWRPRSPRFCFSCMLDEVYARRLFASPNDALFARDALTVQVLQGSVFYERLLTRGPWLSDYFPKLYGRRRTGTGEITTLETTKDSVFRRLLNSFLFLTVGNYIRFKSATLNRKLEREANTESRFKLRIGTDHCIFESVRYLKLRDIYRQFGATASGPTVREYSGRRVTADSPNT